jgi:hypothetical protein
MARRRSSYLLLSLASGALASVATLPACSGSSTTASPGDNAGSGGAAGSAGAGVCSSSHPCGLVVNPNGGSSGMIITGVVPAPSGGFAGAESGGPGDAGAAGAPDEGQGGTGGPCGGHVCGSMIYLGGSGGQAGGKQ